MGTVLGSRLGRPARDRAPLRGYRWTLVGLVVVPPLCRVVHLLVTAPSDRWALFADDSYYYFGVVRNVLAGNGSTFTGLVETNGYHPLWAVALAPAVGAFGGGGGLLFAVVALQSVLWAVTVVEMLRIGRLVGTWEAAAAGVAVYGTFAAISGSLAFTGMESALVVPLLVLTIRHVMTADGSPRTDLVLGLLLALVCLARLDAVIAAVPLGVVALFRNPDPPAVRTRRALRLATPAAAALMCYLALNAAVFGTATPVSGRAKSLGAPFWNPTPLRQYLEAGELAGRPLWFGLAATVFAVAAWRWSAAGDDPIGRLRSCLGALLVGQGGLMTYLVVGTSYQLWPWYHYLVATYAFCATVIVAHLVQAKHGHVIARGCCGVAAAFLIVQALVLFRPEPAAFRPSVAAAEFVQQDLPANAVLAMGDRAGIFGYLADRPLLQLEGLVADADYLAELDSGGMAARMADEGVDYYVHYGSDGRSTGAGCTRFEEPAQGHGPKQWITVCEQDLVFSAGDAGDQLQIWRFRAHLNGA